MWTSAVNANYKINFQEWKMLMQVHPWISIWYIHMELFSVWAHQIFCLNVGGLQYFQVSLKKQKIAYRKVRRENVFYIAKKEDEQYWRKVINVNARKTIFILPPRSYQHCRTQISSHALYKLVWLPYKDKGLLSPLILSLTWNTDHPIFFF